MIRFTVAGNELTDAGLTLQLLAPKVAVSQLTLTVPVKPSSAEIVIGPLVPMLPIFTFGKRLSSLRTKLGLRATTNVNEDVNGCAPAVTACSVTVWLLTLVPAGTVTVAIMFAGNAEVGFTVALGVNAHAAPEMLGVKLQERVTLWLKEP